MMASIARGRAAAAAVAAIRDGSRTRRSFSYLSALEEFPGLPSTNPKSNTPYLKAQSTTIPETNLTIITEPSSSTSTITIHYPHGGSSSESSSASPLGTSLANKLMAFKSGSTLSSGIILRHLEDDGAVPFSYADRFGATVGYTAPPEKAEFLVPLLVTDCSFEKWDVNDALKEVRYEVGHAQSNLDVVMTEKLYAAAYGPQSPLGRPFYATPPSSSSSSLRSFREKCYVLNGAILTATGIEDHDAFVKGAMEGLSESNVGEDATTSVVKHVYTGGEERISSSSSLSGMSHLCLAFEAAGSSVLCNVLKYCFDTEGVSAFYGGGLVGVYGTSDAALTDAWLEVASNVSVDVVEKAKSRAKAEAVMVMTDGGGSRKLAEAMTKCVLEGRTSDLVGIAEAYDAVTVKDVKSAIGEMIRKPPTFVAVGDIDSVPYHSVIASRF